MTFKQIREKKMPRTSVYAGILLILMVHLRTVHCLQEQCEQGQCQGAGEFCDPNQQKCLFEIGVSCGRDLTVCGGGSSCVGALCQCPQGEQASADKRRCCSTSCDEGDGGDDDNGGDGGDGGNDGDGQSGSRAVGGCVLLPLTAYVTLSLL